MVSEYQKGALALSVRKNYDIFAVKLRLMKMHPIFNTNIFYLINANPLLNSDIMLERERERERETQEYIYLYHARVIS